MRVLITGASGFVGSALTARSAMNATWQVRGAFRRPPAALPRGVEPCIVGDLAADADWSAAVRGVDVIVHTAARVHVMHDHTADPLAEFRRANVDGTLALARQAAAAGAARFVFISSIKVNGERTHRGHPFRADDAPAPADPYGLSKAEAETALRTLGRETGMEITIIRPVLVYGPGVKANFLAMMHWLDKGLPLPLGAIRNARSLVALDNLVDLILACVDHPAAANEIFLVSDGVDLSTTGLLRRTAAAMGRPARLIPVPVFLLDAACRALGKGNVAQRLFGSLQVDISATRAVLDWAPPVAIDAALRRTTRDFLERHTSSDDICES